MQRIVIFGATSAIAHACARRLVARGDRLFLVGRDADKLAAARADLEVRAGSSGRVFSRQADLGELSGHAALIAAAADALGGLDIALICHGSLPDQARCNAEPALALREIHLNALSVIHLCGLLALGMEARRGGQLAVIGSVAGDRGRQSNHVYGAAKGMVALYLQGLRNRLHGAGVNVLTIKPGFVATPMTAGIAGRGGPLWATPETVAQGIVAALDRRADVVYLPGWWRPVMALVRALPEALFKRLKL